MADTQKIPEGLFISEHDRIAIATKFGVVEFGMSPEEMRQFATAIIEAADRIDASATAAVDAAFEKARNGGLQ